MLNTSDEVMQYLSKNDIKFVDIRFTDLLGNLQQMTVPSKNISKKFFTEGQFFDASSIKGFTNIENSDLQLIPEISTAYLDPFRKHKTLCFLSNIINPTDQQNYTFDPRQIAIKAEKYLASTGIADTAFFGCEAEFYIFDQVRYETKTNKSFHYIDSVEGHWNSGKKQKNKNLGYKIPKKSGYLPVSPNDHLNDLRNEICLHLDNYNFEVERAHHEVGSGGQCEINYKFDTLVNSADKLQLFKYVVKNVAWNFNKTATFMPKPLFDDNGSGMHVHQSLWSGKNPLFYDEKNYGKLSNLATWYIGGILHHTPSLLALTNPTVNSFRRLVPNFEAPLNLVYSQGNRSAAIRIPLTGNNPEAKRIEFRVPDPASNPYLAFSAQLMAGLDGINKKIVPPKPVNKNLYSLSPLERKNIPQLPTNLEQALQALEKDNKYLQTGGVFSQDFIDTWINYKKNQEILPLQQRPHPYEFELYYNV